MANTPTETSTLYLVNSTFDRLGMKVPIRVTKEDEILIDEGISLYPHTREAPGWSVRNGYPLQEGEVLWTVSRVVHNPGDRDTPPDEDLESFFYSPDKYQAVLEAIKTYLNGRVEDSLRDLALAEAYGRDDCNGMDIHPFCSGED